MLRQVELIAEPWDVGEGGYQVGNFPPLWSEWNGKFRDSVRDDWRGEGPHPCGNGLPLDGQLGPVREAGGGRSPHASINFVTCSRRVHTGRSRLVRQLQAQRGQRGRKPRRQRRQPIVELWCGGSDQRRRRAGAGGSGGSSATPQPSCWVPGCADALARRGRVRSHAAGEQQRLLPGQRDLLARLGAARTPSSWTSAPSSIDFRHRHPVFRRRRFFEGEPICRRRAVRHRLVPAGRRGDDRRRLGRRLRQVARASSSTATRCPTRTRAAAGSPTTASCCCSTGTTATSRSRSRARTGAGGGCGSSTRPATSLPAGPRTAGAKVNVAARSVQVFRRVTG